MPKLSSAKKPLATKVARKLESASKQKVLDLDSIRQGHAVAKGLTESAPTQRTTPTSIQRTPCTSTP